MALYIHPDIQDAALNLIKDNCNKVVICSSPPTTFVEANTTFNIAEQALASSDFTIEAEGSTGRRITIAAKEGIDVDVTGEGHWIALLDTVTPRLLYVTDADGEPLSDTGTVSVPAWKLVFENPTEEVV